MSHKEGNVKAKLNCELMRRRQQICQFYYYGIGQIIKRRRLYLELTQEDIANGICSNTYISKIENNQIVINKECLYLIMERMDILPEKISMPEEMLEYLEQAVELFFYKDVSAYKELYEEVRSYQFAPLLQIIKLGYFVLIEDFEQGALIYNELFRYLNSLEEFGFSIFLIFSSYHNIGVKNYRNGRIILEKVQSYFRNDEMIYGLYNYAKFIIYGNLHLNLVAYESGNQAISIFNLYANTTRINEFFTWKEIFLVYEGVSVEKKNMINALEFLTPSEKNFYLAILSTAVEDPRKYLTLLDEKGDNYLLGQFLLGGFYLKEGNEEEFKKTCDLINEQHYNYRSKIDFSNLLNLLKNDDELMLKDYLTNYVLEFAIKKQNIHFMRIVTDKIVKILKNQKRYKDALGYSEKFSLLIKKFQKDNEIKQ